MLPPVLELYVVWHPGDSKGSEIAEEFFEHFHGSSFTGLIGGAVEVFIRSQAWRSDDAAPRPIPSKHDPLPNGVEHARFVAIAPLMGTEMAAAVESRAGPWHDYIEKMTQQADKTSERVGIFPYLINPGADDGTILGKLLEPYHRIAASLLDADGELGRTLRCRDLVQGVVQLLSQEEKDRLTVFISHTKRAPLDSEEATAELILMVRQVIANTRLREFFDASDLQPGRDWDAGLRSKAASNAMLAIRTDMYSSREWCQREILLAKRGGMPVVIMDALRVGEERGSFLMDHVPRSPVRMQHGQWSRQDVYRVLNLLVDECLKRLLWIHQEELSRNVPGLDIAWWAPHAPEPLTLVHWLEENENAGVLPGQDSDIRILHPDPPLGPEEERVLQELLGLRRKGGVLDIMTPRLLAARGG